MEERIKCINCDNSILQQTALRHGGRCKPCFKQGLMNEIGRTEFGMAYETFFKRPALKTKRYIYCWLDVNHTLAGPLYALRTRGDCKYIFQNKTGIWSDVPDIMSLREWCLRIIAGFRERLSKIVARNSNEAADQKILFRRADELQETVVLAIDFLIKAGQVATE